MTRRLKKPVLLACSFCGKTQDKVDKLVAGPNVYICDVCIDLCAGIVRSQRARFPMLEEGRPEQTLCIRSTDGAITPVTGLDVYLGGIGPFFRIEGTWKKSVDPNGEPGRLHLDLDPQQFGTTFANWLTIGILAYNRGIAP